MQPVALLAFVIKSIAKKRAVMPWSVCKSLLDSPRYRREWKHVPLAAVTFVHPSARQAGEEVRVGFGGYDYSDGATERLIDRRNRCGELVNRVARCEVSIIQLSQSKHCISLQLTVHDITIAKTSGSKSRNW